MHRLYTIALAATLLGSPSASAHPEPPPPLSGARHYIAWDTACPKVDGTGTYPCTLYLVAHTPCECPDCPPRECPGPFTCQAADVTRDGLVDSSDLIKCSGMGSAAAEACGAVVRVFWGQTCEEAQPDEE